MKLSGHLYAPFALPPGNEPPVAVEYEAGWAPETFRVFWRKYLVPAGSRTQDHSAHRLVI